ncbi:MAG: sugar nucleotide-binding protein [Candidatus Nanoarchaeia archaeon]|nr:sugar nucleotide-binding protein [Candidatus Nanoarchaeia archaeon]
MKKILITGESGTIPMQMQRIAKNFGFEVVNTQLEHTLLDSFKTHQSFKVRKPELDFLDTSHLIRAPWDNLDLVIHSGAFVGTDYCSSDPSLAIRTNVVGTQNIVDLCNKYEIPLIYLSTTAILDPSDYGPRKPMTEETKINPQTLYGITKYAGELIVKNTCHTKHLVLRPVFGFGNYPDDLHSALTKFIYIMYKNITQPANHKLKILLNKGTAKSYTRVENIATCILSFAQRLLDNTIPCVGGASHRPVFNIGENHTNSKTWFELFEFVAYRFAVRGICVPDVFYRHIDDWIDFDGTRDYLHYHNMSDDKLRYCKIDFASNQGYIPLETGIRMTIESIINNIGMEPYWL